MGGLGVCRAVRRAQGSAPPHSPASPPRVARPLTSLRPLATPLSMLQFMLGSLRCDVYVQRPRDVASLLKDHHWRGYAGDVGLSVLAKTQSTLQQAAAKGSFMRLQGSDPLPGIGKVRRAKCGLQGPAKWGLSR